MWLPTSSSKSGCEVWSAWETQGWGSQGRGAARCCHLTCLLHQFWGIGATMLPRPVLPRLSGPVTRSFQRYLQPWKPSSVKWTPKLLLLLQCFIHSDTPCHSCMCCYATKMPGVQALRLCWKNRFDRYVSISPSRAVALSAIPKSNFSVLLEFRFPYPQWGSCLFTCL